MTLATNIRTNSSMESLSPADVQRIRADFPILAERANGKSLVYLDNAATTQKPAAVINAIDSYYRTQNANVHRAVHMLSARATDAYEGSREKVRRFLNAKATQQVIFTRGTTEAINLVAQTHARSTLKPGDEVVISHLEHHSNIVPWQMVCEQTGAKLRVIPVSDAGEIVLDEFAKLLSRRTRIVAVSHVSNALGTINPIKTIIDAAHAVGAVVLIDGAQATSHLKVDVQALGCDFYALSGHKMFGPTGIGVLYGRLELLEAMPPYQGGGDMISEVKLERTLYNDLPYKFEAGTPHIAGAIGLGAAVDYLESIGLDRIAAYEHELLAYGAAALAKVPGVRIYGNAASKAAVFSFVMEDPPVASLDLGTQLDFLGIAVRTGHHCCQPLMDRYGIPGTARASLAVYNTREEIDALVAGLQSIRAAELRKSPRSAATPAKSEPSLADVKFPAESAPSPAKAAEELADDLEFLGDWEQRYQYLEEIGSKLPPMPAIMKNEATRVHGCQSVVHMVARKRPGTPDVVEFLADSDAGLVRGLIAVLQKLFSGQRVRDITGFDIEGFFKRVGLDQHLTAGRRNGLESMVKRLRALANKIAEESSGAGT